MCPAGVVYVRHSGILTSGVNKVNRQQLRSTLNKWRISKQGQTRKSSCFYGILNVLYARVWGVATYLLTHTWFCYWGSLNKVSSKLRYFYITSNIYNKKTSKVFCWIKDFLLLFISISPPILYNSVGNLSPPHTWSFFKLVSLQLIRDITF